MNIIKFLLTTNLLFTNYIVSKKDDKQVNYNLVAELDESDLEKDIYEPKSTYSKKLIQINKTKVKNNFAFSLTVDSKKIIEMIENAASNAGMITGDTKFEKLKEKDNLLVSYMPWLKTKMDVIEKNEERQSEMLDVISPRDYLSSEKQSITFLPTAKPEAFRFNFNTMHPKLLRFVQKDKATYSSYRIHDGDYSDFTLAEILLGENESITSQDFIDKYNDFISKLDSEWDEAVPHSNYWEIIYANQNSEKFQLSKGYNIYIKNEAINPKLPGNPNLLLIPTATFIILFLLFSIRKQIQKKVNKV